jgi:hypothetical protein
MNKKMLKELACSMSCMEQHSIMGLVFFDKAGNFIDYFRFFFTCTVIIID